MRPPAWFIYHVPKTGGQTLRNHLRAALGPTAHRHLGRWEPWDAPVDGSVLEQDTDGVLAVTGHPLRREHRLRFPDRAVHEVLILREPVARIVSHFAWHSWVRTQLDRPPVDLERFLDRTIGQDPMTRTVAWIVGEDRPRYWLDAALHAIDAMTVVTTVESLDMVAPRMLAAMGLPPVVPDRANRSGHEIPSAPMPSPSDLEGISSRTHQDAILYRAALRLTNRSIERLEALTDRTAVD